MAFLFFLKGQDAIFQHMGYFSDQRGIGLRYLREAKAWEEHLMNTRTAILNASSGKKKNKAAILGSGWLLDVPLKELSELFSQICLFDIKHPEQVKKQTEKLSNVGLIETDLSGFAIHTYEVVKKRKNDSASLLSSELNPVFNFDLSDFDFIVSCNLLDQLDCILLDYLKKYIRLSSAEEISIRKRIQETHVTLLPRSKSCLITDVDELSLDKHNHITGSRELLYAENIPGLASKEWLWQFDNHYRYNAGCKTWFSVKVYDI